MFQVFLKYRRQRISSRILSRSDFLTEEYSSSESLDIRRTVDLEDRDGVKSTQWRTWRP